MQNNKAIILALALFIFISGCIGSNKAPEPPDDKGGKVCIQVITPAKNPLTGECGHFIKI